MASRSSPYIDRGIQIDKFVIRKGIALIITNTIFQSRVRNSWLPDRPGALCDKTKIASLHYRGRKQMSCFESTLRMSVYFGERERRMSASDPQGRRMNRTSSFNQRQREIHRTNRPNEQVRRMSTTTASDQQERRTVTPQPL